MSAAILTLFANGPIMKLYTYDSAPNPARLKMFLDYKGIEIDTQQIDMTKMEQHSEEFLTVCPNATVPTLVLDDGTRLTEVVAIVHFLESEYPEKPLLGETPIERAMILNWNHRLFMSVALATADAFRNAHPAFKDRALPGIHPVAQIPELAERGKTRLLKSFEEINTELGTRDFMAGANISFADIDLLVMLNFASWAAKTVPDASLGNIRRWKQQAEQALSS